MVSFILKMTVTEGSQGRNLKLKLWRDSAYWFVPTLTFSYLTEFFIPTSYIGMVLPTVDGALLHQLASKNLPLKYAQRTN